jgi:hypothetical protein
MNIGIRQGYIPPPGKLRLLYLLSYNILQNIICIDFTFIEFERTESNQSNTTIPQTFEETVAFGTHLW